MNAQRSGPRSVLRRFLQILGVISCVLLSATSRAADGKPETKPALFEATSDSDQARIAFQAEIKGNGEGRTKSVYSALIHQAVLVSADRFRHQFAVKVDAISGGLTEVVLVLGGEGEVTSVTGPEVADWSIRQGGPAGRSLVIRVKKTESPTKAMAVEIGAITRLGNSPETRPALTLTLEQPALANGFVRLDADPGIDVRLKDPVGLVPLAPEFLPESFRVGAGGATARRLAFRVGGTAYTLPVDVVTADPEARGVVLGDFRLVGELQDETAAFVLTAIARVKNPQGASIPLLSGRLALTEATVPAGGRLQPDGNRFVVRFEKAGEFPLRLKFHAGVRTTNGWNELDFAVAPSVLQPVVLQGLKPDTQFRLTGAARPERRGADFITHLPADGRLNLTWKETRPEAEGALFFAAEQVAQIAVSPGMMRQTALLDFKVLQGEMNRVELRLRGEGEVVRVQGTQVLSWAVAPVAGTDDRRLTVQLNQAQKDHFALQIQLQTPLGAFPLAAPVVRLQPEGAIRFGGYLRIVNAGAVRLEVLEAGGLSQISPEQFPQTEATRALPAADSTQVFAYRFSGEGHTLRLQADSIQPEVSVSQLVTYHLGETELAIDAEIELEVREAPLRELLLQVPRGYAVARLQATDLNDYFLTEPAGTGDAQLRLVYGTPISGRQVMQLRLERNGALGTPDWSLPRIDVVRAKSVRGHVALRADTGFRLTPNRTQGLTEIGTAYFPKKLPGIQSAFRLSEPGWAATVQVERLPQSVQADTFHLFTVGEGIAYGSTLVNYVISGAPVGTFHVALTNEYFNVEFTGKDVRNWQKTAAGYVVQLHTPVTGPYTLLATYERPFKAQGETLRFSGAQPLDAQTEQGHSLVVSTHQFQVQPVTISPGLVRLEPAEVPAEYRLFFDAPILAAYRYTARPFQLELELRPLAQGETVSQVVDRAALTSRISKEGQVVTEGRYFVKNRGVPNLSLALPAGAQLWSVTANGNPVVPVMAGGQHLIPLPPQADPNSVIDLQVKIASRAQTPGRLTVAAPQLGAPILLAEWRIEPETGQRLAFRSGTLTPVNAVLDGSGFAGLRRLFGSPTGERSIPALLSMAGILLISLWAIRRATAEGVTRFSPGHLAAGVLGLLGLLAALLFLVRLVGLAQELTIQPPVSLQFQTAVQQPDAALTADVAQQPLATSGWEVARNLWPLGVALVWWAYTALAWSGSLRRVALVAGWMFLFWGALRAFNGLSGFFLVAGAFVLSQIGWPSLRRWWSVPPKPAGGPPTSDGGSSAIPAGAATVLVAGLGLAGSLMFAPTARGQAANEPINPNPTPPPVAESIRQSIRVDDEVATVSTKIRWAAIQGQVLPLLQSPGVLTEVKFPPAAGRLVRAAGATHALLAEQTGMVELELHYQIPILSRDGERGIALPTQPGLINQVNLTLPGQNAEVAAPHAASIIRLNAGATNQAAFELALSPVANAWIGWRPRSRDTRHEAAVFYGEWMQLFVPAAGVVEGWHQVQIRPAQGELNELNLRVPEKLTITDVVAPTVTSWRFDPEARRLRIGLTPAQSKPFTVLVKSQSVTGPLPLAGTLRSLSLENAAGDVGLVGVATGVEVQLDDVAGGSLAPINLEDFPADLVEPLRAQIPGLAVRRAFRYSQPPIDLGIRASAVEPDVRVESQQTLSLSEDRALLAANWQVNVTRAGIFKLSFVLPPTFDVESISGETLSHWTELKVDTNRIVTLHLKGRTEGAPSFAVSLTAPGARATSGWSVPRLAVREATKQRGQLVVVPEQGWRLQVGARESVTQLDPLQAGVRQKGVLAFRLLQSDWRLALDLERVDAWTQVSSLQHFALGDSQLRVAGNLQYEIENAGVKTLSVRLPAGAENVRFRGEHVADFLLRTNQPSTNANARDWDIKLARRINGRFLLQATYQLPVAATTTNLLVTGIEALDVNLQRGFVTLQSASRLRLSPGAVPKTLQPAEWQSVPRAAHQDLPGLSPNFTFRLVEPAFLLPLRLERHDVAKLLPARVNSVGLTTVISDDGTALTHVRMALVPGDQSLLRFQLPTNAQFWFAFVGRNSVWPWRDKDQLLVPLEQHSRTSEPVEVELFYAARAGQKAGQSLVVGLLAPRFELPLENISWRVFLGDRWELGRWDGALELREQAVNAASSGIDLNQYIQLEAGSRKEKTREAEQFLSSANSLLAQGDPEQARRAFQNAFGLSQHDNAFNEDARVQLHNLKTQQAIVGLNVRQARVNGATEALSIAPRELRYGRTANYTQTEAKQLLDRNTVEENAVQVRLVERLIQQQEATVATPVAIRATLPERGRHLTFARALQVETQSDLRLHLQFTPRRGISWAARATILVLVLGLVALFTWIARDGGTPGRLT